MNCAKANQFDLVVGYQPEKINGDYWAFCLHWEKRKMQHSKWIRPEILGTITGLEVVVQRWILLCNISLTMWVTRCKEFSFSPAKLYWKYIIKEPVHRHQNAIVNEGNATEPAIKNRSRKAAHYRTFALPLSKAGRFRRRLATNSAVKFLTV